MTTTTTTQIRTSITQDSSGHVTIVYEDDDGSRTERRFSAPCDTGYIREHHRDGSTSQPCDRLASTGPTLRASRGSLMATIRREWRARQRQRRSA